MTKIITNFDIMYGIINLFGLADFKYLNAFLLIFVYIVSLIQIVLFIRKFNLNIRKIFGKNSTYPILLF